MTELYIGVGGNIGTEEEILARFRDALARIRALPQLGAVRASPVYRSAPAGPVSAQPPFLNAVLAADAADDVDPVGVLDRLHAIEDALGRERGLPQGPRTLDLDLLLAGDRACDVEGPPRVVLPHPRMHRRPFVLAPLADLAGRDLVIPGVGLSVGRCLDLELLAPEQATKIAAVLDEDDRGAGDP